jgi:hypothetical protein
MALNFNVDPYYDDFDPSKNFHRILFKPGFAVQARELTQSQTILQSQISKFADNIFSQNTPVTGGKVTTNLNCYYLKLVNSTGLIAADFLNKIVQDDTGTILAKVVATAEATGTDAAAGDPPTLVITYLSGIQFTNGSTIRTTDNSATAILSSSGLSSVASISDGVFYVVNGYSYSNTQNADGTYSKYSIGNFVSVQPQTIILSKYSNVPSARVGLSITETIYDYINDSSLLDPAIGATNYQAPGADRYVVILTLTTLSLDIGNDDQFIELVRIDAGSIVKQVNDTVYSKINDYIAKRDYETNGDYIVNDFNLTPMKHGGKHGTDDAYYDLTIGKGLAYVQGYRVENQSQIVLTGNRARTTKTLNNNSVYMDYGSYFVTDNMRGLFDITLMPTVDLHCVQTANIVSTNTSTYNSTLVGTGFIRNLDYQSSTSTNTRSYIYHTYVSDINTQTLTGNAASATSTTMVFFPSAGGKWSNKDDAYNKTLISITSGTGTGQIRTISSWAGATRTATVSQPFSITPDATSNFSLIFSTADVDSIVQKNPSTFALTANTNINVSGKLNSIPTGDTILWDTTGPEMIFKVGYPYVSGITSPNYYTTIRWTNQSFGLGNTMTLTAPTGSQFQGTVSTPIYGEQFKQLFTLIDASGTILDFSNTTNYVTLTSSTSATFTSPTYGPGAASGVTVIANMYVNGSSGTVLKTKTLVTGSKTTAGTLATVSGTSIKVDTTAGQTYIPLANISYSPLSLYVTDLKEITAIYDTGSSSTTISNGAAISSYTDVSNLFTLDNGQRDNYYNHAYITLKPGVAKPRGNILVVYNYYSHGGGDGYFSVGSYTTNDYSETYTAKNGNLYVLRDCIDFRPSRQNGQTSYVWEYFSAVSATHGVMIPNDLSSFASSYSYYLGRKDKLVLTKDGDFQFIEGTPSVAPEFPVEPKGSLLLANITLDPYTTYVPGEGAMSYKSYVTNLSIQKVLHKRWAKSDITDLQDRINNLEYYTSLSLLEQNANSLQIPDANGLNRFKNGILVDDFSSFGVADTFSKNYQAKINIRTKELTPITSVVNFQLQNPWVLSSLGTLANTNGVAINSFSGTNSNIFTLPYTSANVITQPLASSTISVNPFSVTIYEGVQSLTPAVDNWCNSIETPAILTNDPNLQHNQLTNGINLVTAGDWQSIPGTKSVIGTTPTVNNLSYNNQGNQQTASPNGSAMATNKGVVTNTAMAPFIRPQEIIVRTKGMLVNTPIKAWFDGTSVNKWMRQPNVIELTSVSGTFLEDDVVGFYQSGTQKFYAIGRVIGLMKYSGSSKVRLYMSTFVGVPSTIANTTTLTNAYFNASGVFVKSTASGTISGSVLNPMHTTGTVSGVGGGFTTTTVPASSNFYKVPAVSTYSSFLNQNGVWGSVDATVTTFQYFLPVNFSKTGTYTFHIAADNSATVKIGGSSATTGTTVVATTIGYQDAGQTSLTNVYQKTYTGTTTISSTGNTNIGWAVTGTAVSGDVAVSGHRGSFAMTITDPDGFVVWSTLAPPGLGYSNAGTVQTLPDGGQLYNGATQIQLDGNASANTNYYVGGTIYIKSTWTYSYQYGAEYIPSPPSKGDGDGGKMRVYNNNMNQYNAQVQAAITAANKSTIILAASETYTANITAYNATTKVVTLDTPVDISMGNSLTYGVINSRYQIEGTSLNVSLAIKNGTTPSKLSTDEKGNFVGIFNCPGSDFYVGERVFRLDNRTVDSDPTTATTFAESTFHAAGLQNQTSFAATIDSSGKIITPVDQAAYNIIGSYGAKRDPLAQTFMVQKDNYPNGIFINSIKLFFAGKPTTTQTPVQISLVGTDNGYPNGKTLPHSRVVLFPDDVNTSTTPHYLSANTYTTFTFDAPIYVQPGALYAVVVESSSADYTIYYGQQNQQAIVSTSKKLPTDANPTSPSKIGQLPYIGALFESQNALTWSADLTKNLMIVIDKCVFTTTSSPTVSFVTPYRLPVKKLGTSDLLHSIDPNSIIDLGAYFEFNQTMHALNLTTTDLIPSSTGINYQYSALLNNGLSATSYVDVTPGKNANPLNSDIFLDDGQGERILLANSNSSFIMTATLTSTDNNVSPVISDDGVTLYSVQNYINNMGIDSNIISITNGGTGYNSNTVTASISSPDIGSDTPVLSVSTSNGVIESVYVTYPGSGYLTTPTITISDPTTRSGNSNAAVVVLGETSASGGNAYARYITKKVIMTPGNDSGDLRVYYTAYKPLNTQVYVYYKILNSQDTEAFESQSWQLMTQVGKQTTYSKSRDNYIEFECAPGTGGVANNTLSYTSTNGNTYTNFIQFAIKVVMATSDKTSVPIITDIRALALPAGTGL